MPENTKVDSDVTFSGNRNTNPRYQIFVSSTFRDLKEERQAVLDAILELKNFPAGMEIFPAANETPWDLIKSIIAESDYYVLVVGGKYGSTGEDGVSYTEKEYDYAVELDKPILSFLHAEPDNIPVGKSEMSDAARSKLTDFRQKVQERHCKFWNTKDELKSQVIVAITNAVWSNPVPGWVRADGIDNIELLTRLSKLHDQYDALRSENESLRDEIGLQERHQNDIADDDDEVTVLFYLKGDEETPEMVALTWGQIFFAIAEYFLTASSADDASRGLEKLIYGEIHGTKLFNKMKNKNPGVVIVDESIQKSITLDSGFVRTLKIQFLALGLIELEQIETSISFTGQTYKEMGWVLTTKGRHKFLNSVASKK